MNSLTRLVQHGIAFTLLLGATAFADEPRVLTWDDLMPGGGAALQPPPAGHSPMSDEDLMNGENWDEDWEEDTFEEAFSTPVYPTGVVEELDGVLVKLPGFVVPLEISADGNVSEFLLVPYFGACIHYPPPPPNQLVYVKSDQPMDLESTWEPIWVTGELKTEYVESGLGAAGYSMESQKIEAYEY